LHQSIKQITIPKGASGVGLADISFGFVIILVLPLDKFNLFLSNDLVHQILDWLFQFENLVLQHCVLVQIPLSRRV